MSTTVLYIINAVFGALGGLVGKAHSNLSGFMTFIQGLVLVGSCIYAGIVYNFKIVLIVIAISLGTMIVLSFVSGIMKGIKRKENI